jgi:hypothetical protein
VHIAESKTANGIGDMPMTQVASEAFRRQMDETPGSNYLFRSPELGTQKPYMTRALTKLDRQANERGALSTKKAS